MNLALWHAKQVMLALSCSVCHCAGVRLWWNPGVVLESVTVVHLCDRCLFTRQRQRERHGENPLKWRRNGGFVASCCRVGYDCNISLADCLGGLPINFMDALKVWQSLPVCVDISDFFYHE